MRRPGLWESSDVPPIATGRSPEPGFMPLCARARRRRIPDSRKKPAPACRNPAPNGALIVDRCVQGGVMADPESKLRELSSKALECHTADEQAAFLDQVCQGDAEVRARLEELLQAHREAGSFLQEPSTFQAPTLDAPPVQEQPGTVIGPYKL